MKKNLIILFLVVSTICYFSYSCFSQKKLKFRDCNEFEGYKNNDTLIKKLAILITEENDTLCKNYKERLKRNFQKKYTGKFLLYNSSGRIIQEAYLNKGLINGKMINYYSDTGDTSLICNYEKGYKKGEKRTYYNNSQLRDIGRYYNDKKDGGWKYYNKEGKLIKEEIYDKGKLIETK